MTEAKTILQLERDIVAAIKAKDATTLANFVADDFVYRTHFGAQSNKAEFLKSIASIPVEIVSLQGDELNVSIYDDVAILTGVQRAVVRTPESEPEDSAVAFTDVFVRREGRWLMVLAYGVELPSDSEKFDDDSVN
jgi:uncharacterized protein (TIGR02246 family)